MPDKNKTDINLQTVKIISGSFGEWKVKKIGYFCEPAEASAKAGGEKILFVKNIASLRLGPLAQLVRASDS